MKKGYIAIIAIIAMLITVSCEKSPVNYEIPDIVTNNDWVKRTKETVTPEYGVNKKVLVNKFIDNPLTKNDSLELEISQVSLTELEGFPDPMKFKRIISEVFSKCESSCKNRATFKPYKIAITYIDTKAPKEPTKKDSLEADRIWNFMKKTDYAYYKEQVEHSLDIVKKGENRHFIINVDFLASNAYGTPGKLYSIMTYDLKEDELQYNGASER